MKTSPHPVSGLRNPNSARSLFIIIAVQVVLCVALVISIGLNIHQVNARTEAVEQAYLDGRVAGINWSRAVIAAVAAQIIEEEAARQREAETDAHIAEEKL